MLGSHTFSVSEEAFFMKFPSLNFQKTMLKYTKLKYVQINSVRFNVLMTNKMHNSYNQFLFHSFL